jgi:hypothetical protein
MTDINFTPLAEGAPRQSKGGGMRGGSRKTRFYREQLMNNPGQWFIWKVGSAHGSDTGQALRTLVGVQVLTGVDRGTLDYESTAQKQEDGTYTTFVRYTGNGNNTDDIDYAPLAPRKSTGGEYEGSIVTHATIVADVVSNPFGANA